MVLLKASLALVAAALLPATFAHPGHDVHAEAAERAAFLKTLKTRNLDHCAEKFAARGLTDRAIARRAAHVERLQKKRGIVKRDFADVLNTSHHSTEDYGPETPADVLFAGNNSCILQPETTEGPYYVSGELVRENVVEEEPGVQLTYEMQVIDYTTCEPLEGVMVEMWSCNSTGVYGGIAGGNIGGISDERELNNTMLRGIQPSDADGVVLFDTVFPGHYTGRTAHIHIMAHFNTTLLPNATITGGTVSHVGQIFFDQDLITEVELTSPYNTNTQPLTTNAQDGIMAGESETSDPVLQYTYLGGTVDEGLFGWIAFGVNPAANRTVNAAAHYGENGGVANPGGGMPGGPGGPGGPPPSGFPTGGFPPFPTTTAS